METKQLIDNAPDKRFALLIDADNVSAKYIKPILTELSKYGTITYKRIYGDWTLSLHAKWKDALLENSITPVQQFSYTYGKNSTDSAMIIDAMDILYADSVEGFCIVSSDSDFTRLASRLRESGRTVIGMGEKKTPTPFRKACDIFTVLELLVKNERSEKAGPTMSKAEVEQAVVDIIIDNQNNGKATGLGEIGSRMQKRYPDFDVRNYGTNLLSKLLSEFTRVKITKDHSSVAVELVENPETAPEAATTPTEAAGIDQAPAKTVTAPAKAAKTKEADKNAKQSNDAEAETSDKAEPNSEKSSRKPRRKRKILVGPSPDAAEKPSIAESSSEETENPPTADNSPDSVTQEITAGESSDAPAKTGRSESSDAPAEEGRRKSSRARRGGARRKKQATREAVERTPQTLIREIVVNAGEDGVALALLSNKVKAEFKEFKVRDLGFPQMRLYLASVSDFDLEKNGKDWIARIKR